MLDGRPDPDDAIPTAPADAATGAQRLQAPGMETLLQGLPLLRRRLRAKQYLFRAGQGRKSLFLIHAGTFKTCLLSEDGREKITGFRMRGDLLGLDALDMGSYACDAVALDVGEVWELPYSQLCDSVPEFQQLLAGILAREIRRDWSWMLALSTLTAEQRVVSFLLDFATRLQASGFSAHHLLLRMTRAELGNFLALQLETVTRALSHLRALGLIGVDRRDILIENPARLRALLAAGR